MQIGNPSITILFSDASDGCVNGKQVNAMDVKDAMNRGNNLLMTGFLAVLGFGLIPEIIRETEWIDRGDDIVLAILAIAVSAWYLSGNNRFRRSLVPFCLVVVALITKFVALAIEISDPDALGNELGTIPVLLLFVILSGYVLYSTRDLKNPVKPEEESIYE
jgi:hypothetical protein